MEAKLGINVGHGSDVGQVRELNEDYHRISNFTPPGKPNANIALLAVADGMGGAAAGEVASSMATNILSEVMAEYSRAMGESPRVVSLETAMEKAFKLANRKIHQEAVKSPRTQGMGTTLTCVAIQGKRAVFGHVGDSRAFIIRDGKIKQLTSDHTWVAEQLDRGVLTKEDAENHAWKNLITRALGTRVEVTPDIFEVKIKLGDIIVLCSDGLHGQLTEAELLREITSTRDPQSAIEYLIALANQRGGPDNITGIITMVDHL